MELKSLTLQQVFDNMLFGLRKQGAMSLDEHSGYCCYRNQSGQSCGIGFSIEDPELAKRMDETKPSAIHHLIRYCDDELPELQTIFRGIDPLVLRDLQSIHDMHLPGVVGIDDMSSFEKRMQQFAAQHHVVYTLPCQTEIEAV